MFRVLDNIITVQFNHIKKAIGIRVGPELMGEGSSIIIIINPLQTFILKYFRIEFIE
jgi:hypothetical protein